MAEAIRKINVIGHLNPDTDSICAAISYAYLKNQLGDPIYEARRAGTINRETAFVLKHFGFDEPELITSVAPQIKDCTVSQQNGIDGDTSLFAAYTLMRDSKMDTLCITSEAQEIEGIIALKDIANANLDIFDTDVLSEANTLVANVLSTLNAELVLGSSTTRIKTGKLVVGTTPELMDGVVEEGDIVLVSNRYETQQFAVEAGATCLIVCSGAKVSSAVKKAAEARKITVIATPYDTYAAARLISMATPVNYKMIPIDKVMRFSVNTTVDEARKTMTKSRHRYFPVVDESGKYAGLVGSTNLLDIQKKHVILVDHNERSQAVSGLEQAEIMEIVDHHRIGSIETASPAMFRNMPVGCTCTIVYDMFAENGVEIPKNIAGLMLSAILSDTLVFRSPTCTPRDKFVGEQLAKIAGVDIDTYSDQMFDAGAELEGRTPEEVFHQDFKVFSRGSARFGVGQGSFMTEKSRKAAEAMVGPYLKDGAAADELPCVFYMFTDVKSQTTEMMFWGEDAESMVARAFGVQPKDGIAVLPGVVSRKKQVIPALMATYQAIQEEQA